MNEFTRAVYKEIHTKEKKLVNVCTRAVYKEIQMKEKKTCECFFAHCIQRNSNKGKKKTCECLFVRCIQRNSNEGKKDLGMFFRALYTKKFK